MNNPAMRIAFKVFEGIARRGAARRRNPATRNPNLPWVAISTEMPAVEVDPIDDPQATPHAGLINATDFIDNLRVRSTPSAEGPDSHFVDDLRTRKYIFNGESCGPLSLAAAPANTRAVLIVEGTSQGLPMAAFAREAK